MKKIKNSKNRENRRTLLTESGYGTLQEAKKSLGMKTAKADIVYAVLKDMYNSQVEVAVKTQKARQAQQDYVTKKIQKFNEDDKSINFKKLNPDKLQQILEDLQYLQGNKRSILKYGDQYLPLTPQRVQELLKNTHTFWLDKEETYVNHYTAEIFYKIKNIDQITLMRAPAKNKNKNEGAFFKYYHNLDKVDLDEFGIYREKQNEYNENCFVQALISSGVDNIIIQDVRTKICSKYIPTNKISLVAEKHKLYFRIMRLDNHKDTFNYGDKNHKEVLIGLIDQHYFAIKPVKITMYAVKNYFDICNDNNFHKRYGKQTREVNEARYTDSWNVIKYMYQNKDKYLRDIPFEDILDTQYHNEATTITDLEYTETAVIPNEIKEKKDVDGKIVFFDFETTTDETIHYPYMVCNSETSVKYGDKCGFHMLRSLYEKFHKDYKTLILIAHNAGYDFRFILQYVQADSIIERGHNLLEFKGRFYYAKGRCINIILKDSYSIITMPLKKFGKCFNLDQSKEILPYSLYTKANIKKRYMKLTDVKDYCDMQVCCDSLGKAPTKDDYANYFQLFTENCHKWNCIKDDKVDIIEYSKVYCEKDVEVLSKGYSTFGSMLQESCHMDIKNFMSAAQLAHQYMLENNVFDGVYQVSSTPREYIMKCMVGGRTMCAENKIHHITGIIDDFDAVSLYPSAMSRLEGYLKGKPKILENRSYEFLQKQSGYFVQIKVTKVNKHYKFPLMSYISDDGVRIFTNTPKDNLYVCKIDLEDLIRFHKIEFEVIDGYYYDEGRNNNLKEVINFVFNERLVKKKEKNPLEQVYKLIMNSSYGKTLQKAIGEKVEFKTEKDIDNFVDKHYNRIKSYKELYNEDDSYKKYQIKMEVGINNHYNNCHAGVEVLAMSKRIMNEVMCLAEDNGLDIYYQDTDSMHIKADAISMLAQKYNEIYGRELIGKNMGQFHTDFDSDILKGDIHAVECIFLGKKCYIDVLRGDEDNVFDYHIRMKGIPNGSILYKAKTEGRSVLDIYKSLKQGNPETFDLACQGYKACFEYNANYTISTKLKFERTLTFNPNPPSTESESIEDDTTTEVIKPNHYIYKWSCNDSNLIYIGSTKNIEKRRKSHTLACNDDRHKHHNVKLYQTIRENGGTKNWKLEQIDAFVANCKADVQEREQYWIDKLKPSLNMINAKRKPKIKEFDF